MCAVVILKPVAYTTCSSAGGAGCTAASPGGEPAFERAFFRRVGNQESRLDSFCRKTYKSLINQENGSIQDQTIDKPERRSGCGFRRGVGPASRTARPSRSGLVGKLRLGVTAPSHPWKLNRKFP